MRTSLSTSQKLVRLTHFYQVLLVLTWFISDMSDARDCVLTDGTGLGPDEMLACLILHYPASCVKIWLLYITNGALSVLPKQ